MAGINFCPIGQVNELGLNATNLLRNGNYTAGCFTVDTAGGDSDHRRAWSTIPFLDKATNTSFNLTLNLNYTVSQPLSVSINTVLECLN